MTDHARIDFTYWPDTGEVEFHGHEPGDTEGDTAPVPLTIADRAVLIEAVRAIEARRRVVCGEVAIPVVIHEPDPVIRRDGWPRTHGGPFRC